MGAMMGMTEEDVERRGAGPVTRKERSRGEEVQEQS